MDRQVRLGQNAQRGTAGHPGTGLGVRDGTWGATIAISHIAYNFCHESALEKKTQHPKIYILEIANVAPHVLSRTPKPVPGCPTVHRCEFSPKRTCLSTILKIHIFIYFIFLRSFLVIL